MTRKIIALIFSALLITPMFMTYAQENNNADAAPRLKLNVAGYTCELALTQTLETAPEATPEPEATAAPEITPEPQPAWLPDLPTYTLGVV